MCCNNQLRLFYFTAQKVQPEPGVLEFNQNSGPSRSLHGAQPELLHKRTSQNSCISSTRSPYSTRTAKSKFNQNFDVHFSSSVEEEVFETDESMSPEMFCFLRAPLAKRIVGRGSRNDSAHVIVGHIINSRKHEAMTKTMQDFDGSPARTRHVAPGFELITNRSSCCFVV